MRFHGKGEPLGPTHPDYAAVSAHFPPLAGLRAMIRVNVERISDSCGYGVPLMPFERERDALPKWVATRGDEGIRDYQRQRNAASLDGLEGVDWL
jgi:hypothetical protein